MHHRRWLVGLVIVLLVALWPTGSAHQRQTNPLDAPLLAANWCGGGLPGDVHFTFAATGDTFPHEPIQAVGEQRGYDYLFDHIRPFLQAADLAYTNFDGAMLAGSGYTGYPNFNYNPALAGALKNAGIGLFSTANNHILDRGPAGIDATLDVLARYDILQHGVVSSTADPDDRPPYLPITLTRDGRSVTIGFLSFSWGTNGIPDPHNQVNLLWHSNAYGEQGGVRPEVLDAIPPGAPAVLQSMDAESEGGFTWWCILLPVLLILALAGVVWYTQRQHQQTYAARRTQRRQRQRAPGPQAAAAPPAQYSDDDMLLRDLLLNRPAQDE